MRTALPTATAWVRPSRKAYTLGMKSQALRRLKWGIYLYLLLLIFEGALRKWVLPGLATPLLIIRDPVSIWLIYSAYQADLFKSNVYTIVALAISLVALITAILFGHSNLTVALYGSRILLIHFPILFIMGRVLTREDVIKIGRVLLWITPPMTVLMAMQFYSPQSALVNRGVGGDMEGGGFSGAMGFFRPPGTFSFTTGLTNFFSLVAAYVFFFWLESPSRVNRVLLLVASACLLAAIPLSISRSLLFSILLSAVFAMAIVARKPRFAGKMALALGGCFLILVGLSTTSFFQTATEAFTERIEFASDMEGGVKGTLIDRFLGGMAGAIADSEGLPFWGFGVGMGTNAGAMLMTGKVNFLIAEGEWGRLIGEMGILLGLSCVFLRLYVAGKLTWLAFRAIDTENFLPWMLLSFAFLNVIQGQWAQPTALGFSILSGGLTLAAFRKAPAKSAGLQVPAKKTVNA
ncbi:hypothetical protein [Siphonobacter sp. BAB-5405]|uniref:hypothetical protein n=1 Tax=Siphonobacter sp. BAB-5405 TaxID=1864825 RepID=UPI001E4D077B|nr:hypothetical protein [Siphonobacter sp. BAB-5405]